MTVPHADFDHVEVALPEMLRAIAHWYGLAAHAEEWAGYYGPEGGMPDAGTAATWTRKAVVYADTARSLRLELETGESYCPCHLMTAADRAARRIP